MTEDPYGVPTGYVPKNGIPDAPKPSGEFDAAINKALDEYELLHRKADAFDKLVTALNKAGPAALSEVEQIIDNFVSPDTLKHRE